MPGTQKTTKAGRAKGQRAVAYCRYHCGVCHRHFSSLTAFDAHRRGEFKPETTIEGRHCVGLEYLTETSAWKFIARSGVCDLTKGSSRLSNVPIWGDARKQPKGIHA